MLTFPWLAEKCHIKPGRIITVVSFLTVQAIRLISLLEILTPAHFSTLFKQSFPIPFPPLLLKTPYHWCFHVFLCSDATTFIILFLLRSPCTWRTYPFWYTNAHILFPIQTLRRHCFINDA